MKTRVVIMCFILLGSFGCSKMEDFKPINEEVYFKTKSDSIVKVGEFNGTSITVLITSSEIDSISNLLISEDIIDAEINVVQIDDQAPCDVEAIPYLLLQTTDSYKQTQVFIKLMKVLNTTMQPCTVEYYLSAYATDAPNGGTCTGVGCSSCSKLRNWFGGPVIGCECNVQAIPDGYCNHTTGGGWAAFLIGLIVGIIT